MISRDKRETKQGPGLQRTSQQIVRSIRRLVEMEDEIRLLTGGTAGTS